MILSSASGRVYLGALGVLLASAALATPGAQTSSRGTVEQRRHVQTVQAERAAHFYALWAEADEDRRALATAELVPSRRADELPAFDRVARASHWLEGFSSEQVDSELQAFADAVDLQVVPGAFESRAEGRGDSLVVRLYLVQPARLDADLEVSLHWLGPEGERIEARREPFPASVFQRIGFNMYVRAPLASPGAWRLQAEMVLNDQSAFTNAVPVDCVERLESRMEGLGARAPEALLDLMRQGVRPLGGGVARRLARAEGTEPPVARRIHDGDGVDARLQLRASASIGTDGPVLVFVMPMGESSEALFHGPIAEPWRAVAERRGADLVALEVTASLKNLFQDALRSLDGIYGDRPLILVARGEAVSLLPLLFASVRLPVDGLVLTATKVSPGKVLPEVPMLLVPGQAGVIVPNELRTLVQAPAPTSFLSDLELPTIVDGWLETNFPNDR